MNIQKSGRIRLKQHLGIQGKRELEEKRHQQQMSNAEEKSLVVLETL